MQIESSLIYHKCKANKINDEYDMNIIWEIMTDVKKQYFMECMLDKERKLSFKLLKSVVVVYNNKNIKNIVMKVLVILFDCQRKCKSYKLKRQ